MDRDAGMGGGYGSNSLPPPPKLNKSPCAVVCDPVHAHSSEDNDLYCTVWCCGGGIDNIGDAGAEFKQSCVTIMPLEWLFGKKMTPEELLRKNQRALNKAMRDLDREKSRMEQQEKKIIMDIKKLAKDGQMDAVKIMAMDLVRTRRYVKKFMLMKANIQAVSLKIQTLRSQNAMAEAMKGVTKAMQSMNRYCNSEIMDMKEEMMNDAMDDAMEDEGDEEESDAVVSQVLDELGLQLNDKLSGLPQASGSLAATSKQPAQPVAAGGGPVSDADADLQARLDNLRRE
uniref:(California timema) hypothetical protein n=1 Tax=Timema californicum TaxID=61474 RepID=A0A7R9J0Y9_TIMCA|nr:unnamed protein product [Timema californicum]